MPTYDYECKACGHTFDELQSFSEPPLTRSTVVSVSRPITHAIAAVAATVPIAIRRLVSSVGEPRPESPVRYTRTGPGVPVTAVGSARVGEIARELYASGSEVHARAIRSVGLCIASLISATRTGVSAAAIHVPAIQLRGDGRRRCRRDAGDSQRPRVQATLLLALNRVSGGRHANAPG